jgi:hypothetical protein
MIRPCRSCARIGTDPGATPRRRQSRGSGSDLYLTDRAPSPEPGRDACRYRSAPPHPPHQAHLRTGYPHRSRFPGHLRVQVPVQVGNSSVETGSGRMISAICFAEKHRLADQMGDSCRYPLMFNAVRRVLVRAGAEQQRAFLCAVSIHSRAGIRPLHTPTGACGITC